MVDIVMPHPLLLFSGTTAPPSGYKRSRRAKAAIKSCGCMEKITRYIIRVRRVRKHTVRVRRYIIRVRRVRKHTVRVRRYIIRVRRVRKHTAS